jgi:arylsulfatase A-like enzyme
MHRLILLATIGLYACDSVDTVSPGRGPDSGTGDSTATHDSGSTALPESTTGLEFVGAKPKNVLMISLDATRRDQVGWFSGLDTTPNLDAVMQHSVVLEDHRSCSNWTAPSVSCVLLGYMPYEQGWWPTATDPTFPADENVPWVPDDVHPLAEQLQDAGYNTLLLTSNPVFSPTFGGGLTNGFAEVREPFWFPAPDVASRVITAATEMQADGRPFYLHVHFIDPHAPYKAPVEYDTDADELGPFAYALDDEHAYLDVEAQWNDMTQDEQQSARNYDLTIYRGELRYWDATFADMWAQLDEMGFLDDTLVVFWTDHGEQFHEHGAWHHGVSLFEQENRATAFFWAKNIVPKAFVGSTTHQDIAPTVLDVLDLAPVDAHTGIKLGDAPADRTYVTFNYINGWGVPRIAYIDGEMKLLYVWNGEKYLEDLSVDPDEKTNLYSPTDARAIAMWDHLLPEVEQIETQWPTLVAVDPGP